MPVSATSRLAFPSLRRRFGRSEMLCAAAVLSAGLLSQVDWAEGTSKNDVSNSESPIPVAPAGEQLAQAIDELDVEHNWLRSRWPVAWKSGRSIRERRGVPVTPAVREGTHCSAFVAAVAGRLGVPLLRPPDHRQTLLSNAQFDWLLSDVASAYGWLPVDSPVEAQSAANRGELVIATYRNPDPRQPGHIAVVRPFPKPPQLVEQEGPQIVQAGFNNYRSASLQAGFSYHRGAWVANGKREVRFFRHAIAGRN